MPTTHHVGFAGEAVVASEFSIRGYTVSLPMVDQGNDLFVENFNTGHVWRVQVKTATASGPTLNYYQFSVRTNAIHAPGATVSHFVFVLRVSNEWRVYVIAAPVVSNYVQQRGMGTNNPGQGTTVFTFIHDQVNDTVACSGVALNGHRNDWLAWPVI